jgi:hypothetical protein
VVALQRTAGNTAVSGVLQKGRGSPGTPRMRDGDAKSDTGVEGVAPGLVQRDLTIKPEDLGEAGKKSKLLGQDTYQAIKDLLKEYHASNEANEKYARFVFIRTKIDSWRKANEHSSTGSFSKRKLRIDLLEKDMNAEEPRAKRQAEYIDDMRKSRFDYASSEAKPQLTKTDELMRGKTGEADKGTGQDALNLVTKYRLTDAELLAIKIYSVGVYNIINPTMREDANPPTNPADKDKKLKEGLPYLSGLAKDTSGQVVPPPGPEPADPRDKQTWQKQKARFDQAAADLLKKTDLKKVKAEARRHPEVVEAGLRKLPPFDSSKDGSTYRGMRIPWKEYQERFATKGDVVADVAFGSTSKTRTIAEEFAIKKDAADDRVGILLICTLTGKNARDMEPLSEHGREKEVLLLPNARLKIDDVRAHPTRRYDHEVFLTEV